MACLLFLLIFSFNHVKAYDTSPPLAKKWRLIYNEEFNEISQKIWNQSYINGRKTPIKGLNFFNPLNNQVKHGRLHLITKADSYINKRQYQQGFGILQTRKKENRLEKFYRYSSGAINSQNKFHFKYGYIETAVKLPSVEGLNSAFWLMPEKSFKKSDSKIMEIDIFEQLSEWSHKKFSFSAHYLGKSKYLKSFNKKYKTKENLTRDKFVKIGLYWKKDYLAWYLNGDKVCELKSKEVMDIPAYIIFSGHVGGWAKTSKDYKNLPDSYVIDYLRIWQEIE